MGRDEFSKMLMDMQAKYLLNRGKHITNINRHGLLVALYALGKRFYEIVYSYPEQDIVKVEELSTERVMKDYLNVL